MCFVSTCPLWQTQYYVLIVFRHIPMARRIHLVSSPPLSEVSVLKPLFPLSQHRPLSTQSYVYGGRQKNTNHRACTAHAHTPATRNPTATATPITSTSTTTDAAATVRYLTIDRSTGMK